jgi:hypothetical protein
MTNKQSTLRKPDAQLLAFISTIIDQCHQHLEWTVNPPRLTTLNELYGNANTAYAVNNDRATHTLVTSANKKHAFAELKHFMGTFIDYLEGNLNVPDTALAYMGLRPRTHQGKQPLPPSTPPHAASTQTWVFGTQTWSDAIHIPDCNKSSFTDSYTDPHCRSYISGENTWYYYNWSYVNQNAATLCPSPWRVPTMDDFSTLESNTDYSTLTNEWGLGGYFASYGMEYEDRIGILWTLTEDSIQPLNAIIISYTEYYTYVGYGISGKNNGCRVRCVK